MMIDPVAGGAALNNSVAGSGEAASTQAATGGADAASSNVALFDHVAQMQMEMETGLFGPALMHGENLSSFKSFLEGLKEYSDKQKEVGKRLKKAAAGDLDKSTRAPVFVGKQHSQDDTGVAFWNRGPAAEPLPGPLDAAGKEGNYPEYEQEMHKFMRDILDHSMRKAQIAVIGTVSRNVTRSVESLIKGQ